MHKVSVIIRAHDCANRLSACIESVLAQTGVTSEIIVVDDGSTDGAADIAAGFAPGLLYLKREKAGPAAALNAGLRQATGECLTFLDADALFTPGALASQAETLAEGPRAGWCVCANQLVSVDGEGKVSPAGVLPLFKDKYPTHLCHFNFMPVSRHAQTESGRKSGKFQHDVVRLRRS